MAELNPICHLLALLGGATIVVVSRLRFNSQQDRPSREYAVKQLVEALLYKLNGRGFDFRCD